MCCTAFLAHVESDCRSLVASEKQVPAKETALFSQIRPLNASLGEDLQTREGLAVMRSSDPHSRHRTSFGSFGSLHLRWYLLKASHLFWALLLQQQGATSLSTKQSSKRRLPYHEIDS